jgi:hypothetical protein
LSLLATLLRMFLYVVKILGHNTHRIVTSDNLWQTAGQGTKRGLLAKPWWKPR